MRAALSIVALLLAPALHSATVTVSDPEAARLAVRKAQPGDTIILTAGEWKDADLRLDGEGTAAAPITIRAQTPGQTVFTGASRLRLGGSHLVVSGLHLRNLSGAKADWLEFRIDSKRRAAHCRVTDCALTEDSSFTAAETENRWIGLYGESNQLDHCRIEGKKNKGATTVVWLGDQDPGRHHLHHNHFGARPRLGKNGGETLRIGDSSTSMQEARCLVENNLFHQCNGETECISNKSCGNTYRANTFLEVEGTLTLRHGNRCIVENNLFLGNHQKHTGGIRVIGEDHQILDNHLQDLEGDGFRTALTLVNGLPDSPLNGYWQVKNALLRGNTVLNCKHSLLIGYNDIKEATLPPVGTRLEANRIAARAGQPAIETSLPPNACSWKDNQILASKLDIKPQPGLELNPSLSVKPRSAPAPESFGPAWFPR
jgi:poly(beta-D-mannuronate) lyase